MTLTIPNPYMYPGYESALSYKNPIPTLIHLILKPELSGGLNSDNVISQVIQLKKRIFMN